MQTTTASKMLPKCRLEKSAGNATPGYHPQPIIQYLKTRNRSKMMKSLEKKSKRIASSQSDGIELEEAVLAAARRTSKNGIASVCKTEASNKNEIKEDHLSYSQAISVIFGYYHQTGHNGENSMGGIALKHDFRMGEQIGFENKDYWEDSGNLKSETICKSDPETGTPVKYANITYYPDGKTIESRTIIEDDPKISKEIRNFFEHYRENGILMAEWAAKKDLKTEESIEYQITYHEEGETVASKKVIWKTLKYDLRVKVRTIISENESYHADGTLRSKDRSIIEKDPRVLTGGSKRMICEHYYEDGITFKSKQTYNYDLETKKITDSLEEYNRDGTFKSKP